MILLSLIIIVSYIGWCIWKDKKIIQSFSQAAYVSNKLVFVAVFFTVGLLLIQPIYEIEPIHSVLIPLSLFLVGISPIYKSTNKAIHFVGGYTAGAATQSLVFLINPYFLFTWILYIPAHFRKERTFYAEVICFINLYLALLWNHLYL